MIIGVDAITPKAASATSTYPALIVRVYSSSSDQSIVRLKIFCPSVMNGTPKDALYAINNVVDAPKYPHNNAEAYDFKVGGVIIVSFTDGNVSSPQFVRYVNVSEDIIEDNLSAIKTGKVKKDAIFSSFDLVPDINDDILKRGRSLLNYVQFCAKGSTDNNDIYTLYQDDEENYVYAVKCNKYGTEFICKEKDSNFTATKLYRITYLNYLYGSTNMKPQLSFLSFCKTIFNESKYRSKDGGELTNILEYTYKTMGLDEGEYNYKNIIKGESQNLYLWQMVAGICDWELGAYTVSSNIYNKNKEKPNIVDFDKNFLSDNQYFYTDSFYTSSLRNFKSVNVNNSEVYTVRIINSDTYEYNNFFTPIFWREFSKTFNNELDLLYAATVQNNLSSISSSWGCNISDIICVLCAVIATAYPLIESVLIKGSSVFNPSDESASDSKLKDFLKELEEMTGDYETDNIMLELETNIEHFAIGFADIYFWFLGSYSKREEGEYNELYQLTINNIKIGIEQLLNNFTSLDASYKEKEEVSINTSSSSSSSNPPKEDINNVGGTVLYPIVGGTDSSQFLWPVPGVSEITSPFGPRILFGSEDPHQGIDIDAKYNYIIASKSGTVINANIIYDNYGSATYGNLIIIDHGDGTKTYYAHLHEMFVNVGDKVEQGTIIAISGGDKNVDGAAAGNTTGPHLHFEIRVNNVCQDPQIYVKPN